MQRPAKPFTPVRFRLQPPIEMTKYVLISGGFDPIHEGHLDLINGAAKAGKVIAIVNSDKSLVDKKGYFFMNQDQRINVIKNLKNVHDAYISIDKDSTVRKTIESIVKEKLYKIAYFANGGDRSKPEDIPEREVCESNSIELIFNVGGDKIQSSSILTQSLTEKILNLNNDSSIVKKPWGYFRNFIYEDNYLLKKIVILPQEEISYQSHKYRDEHWIIVKGEIEVTKENKKLQLSENNYLFIQSNTKHKMTNHSDTPVVIIEVQTGKFISEDDIERFEDKYQRD